MSKSEFNDLFVPLRTDTYNYENFTRCQRFSSKALPYLITSAIMIRARRLPEGLPTNLLVRCEGAHNSDIVRPIGEQLAFVSSGSDYGLLSCHGHSPRSIDVCRIKRCREHQGPPNKETGLAEIDPRSHLKGNPSDTIGLIRYSPALASASLLQSERF